MRTDQRFRIAVEAAPNGMIMIDESGEIVLANSTAAELFGYTEEERIRTSLDEKEILLQEIHHRVKNNLQVISSLLRLQERSLKDDATRGLFAEARNRILSMAMIHERLYESESLANIDLREYIHSLFEMLHGSYSSGDRRIDLEMDVDPIKVDVDTAVPLALLVNELISNIFKYAFPDGRSGTIRIGLGKLEEGPMRLYIEDDGVGLPEGVDLDGAKTLGLRLIRLLSQQLGGKPSYESRPGSTRFSLEFETFP